MTLTRLPSLDIPESEKYSYTEADVHSKLFEPDMTAIGFPSRTSNQAMGEWFQEQRTLALRRLKSKQSRGQHDGLYLIGNSPVVLCELKRYDALDSAGDFEKAKRQLIAYALSEDFQTPPGFRSPRARALASTGDRPVLRSTGQRHRLPSSRDGRPCRPAPQERRTSETGILSFVPL